MLSLLLFQRIAELFLMIFMGWIVVKVGVLKTEDSRCLSMILLYVITSCVFFNAFQIERTPEVVSMMGFSAILAVAFNAVMLLLARLAAVIFHMDVVEEASSTTSIWNITAASRANSSITALKATARMAEKPIMDTTSGVRSIWKALKNTQEVMTYSRIMERQRLSSVFRTPTFTTIHPMKIIRNSSAIRWNSRRLSMTLPRPSAGQDRDSPWCSGLRRHF